MTRSIKALKTRGRIRVGLVGERGRLSEQYIPVLGMLPDYELIGILDPDEPASGNASGASSVRTFLSVEELTADEQVDLVAVASDTPRAYEVISESIAAGRDVYSEWPMGLGGEDLAGAAALAKRAGVRSLIGLHPRVCETSRFVLDLVSQGFLGNMRSVHFYADCDLLARPRHHASKAVSSIDVISPLAGNYLDALFAMVGKPRHLSGLLADRRDVGGRQSATSIQLCMFGTLENGAPFSVHINESRGRQGRLQLWLTGDKGSLKVNGSAARFAAGCRCTIEGCQGAEENDRPIVIPRTYAWHTEARTPNGAVPLANLFSAFANDLHEATNKAPSFDDGAWIHRLLQSVSESSTNGIRVGPPKVAFAHDTLSLHH